MRADQATHDAQATAIRRRKYLTELSAEIRILIRALANDPNRRLSNLSVDWRDENDNPRKFTYPDIVRRLASEEANADAGDPLMQIGMLQAVKDALIGLTQPATGLTVAYTSLVGVQAAPSDNSESTYSLARQAYPGIERSAAKHRRFILLICVFVLLLTGLATWEATYASVGKSMLQVLDPLRTQQAAIFLEKQTLEVDLEKHAAAQGHGAMDYVAVCDRHLFLNVTDAEKTLITDKKVELGESGRVRDVCSRDRNLAASFNFAHLGLQQFMYSWTDLPGGVYVLLDRGAQVLMASLNPRAQAADQNTPSSPTACAKTAVESNTTTTTPPADPSGKTATTPQSSPFACGDIELLVAPKVQVTSGFILPFIFGTLGSLIYVLLHHFSSLKTNTLSPQDYPLARLRVILGIVVAVSVSLLATAYAGPAPIGPLPGNVTLTPAMLASSVTFSIPGLAFLAGFGAEAVFSLLHQMVERLFALPK